MSENTRDDGALGPGSVRDALAELLCLAAERCQRGKPVGALLSGVPSDEGPLLELLPTVQNVFLLGRSTAGVEHPAVRGLS